MLTSFKQYWQLLLAKERWQFRILLMFMIFNGLVELVAVAVVPLYLKVITEPTLVTASSRLARYWPKASTLTNPEIILYGSALLMTVYTFKLAVNVLLAYYQERFIRGRELRMSVDLLKRYLYAPITFHTERNSAILVRNAQTEIQTLNNSFVVQMFTLLTQLFIAPLIFITLLLVNPFVTVVSIGVLVIAVLLYNFRVVKPLSTYRDTLQATRGKQLQSLNQALGTLKELKVLEREDFFLNEYRKLMQAKVNAIIRTQFVARLNVPYLEYIALLGMMLISGLLFFSGASIETVVAMLAFYGVSMFRLKQSFGLMLDAYTAAKVNHIAVRPVYEDMTGLSEPELKGGAPLKFEDSIRLNNVSFIYPNTDNYVLNGVNLTIRKGESIGIVGTTGAGKTTLVDVLLGVLDPVNGAVTVDGVSIAENMSGWHRMIGYVPQQIYLLDDTIRANVAFGLPVENIREEDIWDALHSAQLEEFVRSLPQGLDTIVGERGVRLSGGQRQRIGIARALYHKPSVLVMDEATSALDNKTEKDFVEALEQLWQKHTLIVIAHRPSSIRRCDKIIIMEQGRVRAEGKFEQLLDADKVFQELTQ